MSVKYESPSRELVRPRMHEVTQALDRVRNVVVDERAVEHELAGPLRRLRTLDLRVVRGPVEEDDRVWVDVAVQRVGVFVEAFVGCGVGAGGVGCVDVRAEESGSECESESESEWRGQRLVGTR